MKRISAFLLALCLATAFTGCGKNNHSSSQATETDSPDSLNDMIISDRYGLHGNSEKFETEPEESAITAELGEAKTQTGTRPTSVSDSQSVTSERPLTTSSTSQTTIPTTPSPSLPLEVVEVAGHVLKYYQLNLNQRIAYDDIINGIVANKKDIIISSRIDQDDLYKVYETLLTTADIEMYCPMRAYKLTYNGNTGFIYSVSPEYAFTPAQISSMQKELRACTDEIISKITSGMNQFDTVKVLHDEIIKRCEYNTDVLKLTDHGEIDKIISSTCGDSAYGALIGGKAVCEGYARALMYLCKRVNIPCELVTGWVDGMQHMWNMVCIDNKWYNIDVTWDDPFVLNGASDYDKLHYTYFNLTNEQISVDHKFDSSMFKIPDAFSTDANYYNYNKLIASSIDEASAIIKQSIIKEIGAGGNVISLKFSSTETMNTVLSYFYDSNGITEVLNSINLDIGTNFKRNNLKKSIDGKYRILKISFSNE